VTADTPHRETDCSERLLIQLERLCSTITHVLKVRLGLCDRLIYNFWRHELLDIQLMQLSYFTFRFCLIKSCKYCLMEMTSVMINNLLLATCATIAYEVYQIGFTHFPLGSVGRKNQSLVLIKISDIEKLKIKGCSCRVVITHDFGVFQITSPRDF
jgi:hypothetical protein